MVVVGFLSQNKEETSEAPQCTSVHEKLSEGSDDVNGAKRHNEDIKRQKGIWWMPRHEEAMKDV